MADGVHSITNSLVDHLHAADAGWYAYRGGVRTLLTEPDLKASALVNVCILVTHFAGRDAMENWFGVVW